MSHAIHDVRRQLAGELGVVLIEQGSSQQQQFAALFLIAGCTLLHDARRLQVLADLTVLRKSGTPALRPQRNMQRIATRGCQSCGAISRGHSSWPWGCSLQDGCLCNVGKFATCLQAIGLHIKLAGILQLTRKGHVPWHRQQSSVERAVS